MEWLIRSSSPLFLSCSQCYKLYIWSVNCNCCIIRRFWPIWFLKSLFQVIKWDISWKMSKDFQKLDFVYPFACLYRLFIFSVSPTNTNVDPCHLCVHVLVQFAISHLINQIQLKYILGEHAYVIPHHFCYSSFKVWDSLVSKGLYISLK